MKFVCEDCFNDRDLKGFITTKANLNKCEYCGKDNVCVIDISELVDFFREFFDCFQPSKSGKSLISIIQEQFHFFKDTDSGTEIINDIMNISSLDVKSSNDHVDFSDEIKENINYWSVLKDKLKWKNRYIIDIEHIVDLGWDGFFNDREIVNKNSVLYRARLHSNADDNKFSEKDMSCPPKELSTAGRANPMGIPYLYLSNNKKTVLYEIRAAFLDEVSIASFKIKNSYNEDVVVSDFTENPSLFESNEVSNRVKTVLLKKLISRDLSKPIRRYDSELDYIPTQFICEFIKEFTKVDGIKFKSSLDKDGVNVVIFNKDIMECTEVQKVQVSEVTINFNDI